MRVEPHGIGSVVHVIKRGSRGMKIVKDGEDKQLFLRALFYLNDSHFHENWKRDTANLPLFGKPDHWLDREPLVDILAWTLLPNHFHLLLQEKVEGGIGKFMQRLCGSMTKSFNKKYKEKGSLFQGSYRGKTVESDTYVRQLAWYILVKNVLEMYPGGISAAIRKFDDAWDWGIAYPYSGFGIVAGGKSSPILSDPDGLVAWVFQSPRFKKEAKEWLSVHKFRSDELKDLALEQW